MSCVLMFAAGYVAAVASLIVFIFAGSQVGPEAWRGSWEDDE